MKYKPLNEFLKQTDELKKLIAEHPDYPIVVICSSDVVSDDYGWWYAPSLSFSIGEILDCEQSINDMKVYIDRDDFEDDVRDKVSWDDNLADDTDEAYEEKVQEILKQYEPYWKNVIQISADV